MDVVVELFVTAIGIVIYGTQNKPKHPVWRNAVRLIAFGGAGVCALTLLKLVGEISFAPVLLVLWITCALIVLSCEYYIGSKRVALAAIVAFLTLLVLAMVEIFVL